MPVEFKHGTVLQQVLQWKQILRGGRKRLFGQAWPPHCWLQVQEVRRLCVPHTHTHPHTPSQGSYLQKYRLYLSSIWSFKFIFDSQTCQHWLIKVIEYFGIELKLFTNHSPRKKKKQVREFLKLITLFAALMLYPICLNCFQTFLTGSQACCPFGLNYSAFVEVRWLQVWNSWLCEVLVCWNFTRE